MAKNKSAATPHYELLYIIANKFSENELEPIVEKVAKLIEEGQGTTTHTEDWGKKKLAYPINGYTHGYYRLVEFDMEAANLARVERNLRMMPEVVRHMIVKKDLSRVTPIPRPAAAPKPELPVKAEKEVKEEKQKEKTNLKDLDEKLDKILETNDLL
ncbi:30S ribosomal protein S6 [Candidatus Falkowbacteria bacterium]|nr:30S ribosomal protein S6 [Candidatus Falkowbacteria bacterium]